MRIGGRRGWSRCFILASWCVLTLPACGDDGGASPDGASSIDALISDARADATADAASTVDARPPADAPPPPSRYYGNVPIVLDPDTAVAYEAGHLADDSNLVALHIDAIGIPWQEFASGGALPAGWLSKLADIDDLVAELGLPIYLPLTPISADRRHLTADAANPYQPIGGDCLADVSDWDARAQGYKAYVTYMVDHFDPVFLALSIEVNSFVTNCPDAWPQVRTLLNEIYAEQKALHPGLPVFHTFTANGLWQATGACYGFTEDCVDAGLAAIGDLSGDLFAISTYPLIPYLANGNTLPANWFSIFQDKTGKPIAISETGWQFYSIETRDPDNPGECVTLPSSSAAQLAWVNRILSDAETFDMPFVVWWADRDYLPGTVSPYCVCDDPDEPWCDFVDAVISEADPTAFSLRFFAMMGLRDYGGVARPSRDAWAAAVAGAAP